MTRWEGYGYVYMLKGGGYLKIGITADHPRKRKRWFDTNLPFPVKVVDYVYVPNPRQFEAALHERHRLERAAGTEWFEYDDELLSLTEARFRDLCDCLRKYAETRPAYRQWIYGFSHYGAIYRDIAAGNDPLVKECFFH